MKKILLVLGILLVFGAASAQAGFNFGVKQLSLTELDVSATEYFDQPIPLQGSQALGFYLGFDVSPQVVLLGGLDFSMAKYSEEFSVPGITDIYETSYTMFSPNVGIKFYLGSPASGNICPYLQGGLFMTFSSVSIEEPGVPSEVLKLWEDYFKELTSPFGFYPAFGVEYFASENFSVGGEMGIRFSFASGKAELAPATWEVKNNRITSYIGVTLNYLFGGRE